MPLGGSTGAADSDIAFQSETSLVEGQGAKKPQESQAIRPPERILKIFPVYRTTAPEPSEEWY